eukprot:762699-Hanusia_phi.AAC.4
MHLLFSILTLIHLDSNRADLLCSRRGASSSGTFPGPNGTHCSLCSSWQPLQTPSEKHVGIGEASDEGETAEGGEARALACKIGHGHVPGLEAREAEGCAHLAVAVAALLADDGDLGGRGGELPLGLRVEDGSVDERRLARLHRLLLLLHAVRVGLQLVQREARALPAVAQRGHTLLQLHLTALPHHLHLVQGQGLSDPHAGDAGVSVGEHDCIQVLPRHLHHQPDLLVEESGKGSCPCSPRHVEPHSAVAGERHLEHRSRETSVAPVVSCRDHPLADELLGDLERSLEPLGLLLLAVCRLIT